MAIYITESAAENALVQEANFYPEDQKSLSSNLFKNNRVLNLINMGKGASLKIDAQNNEDAVKLLHIALFTIIPEMPGVSETAKTSALELKWNNGEFVGQFVALTEWLVNYFQENTAELSEVADGQVGRKTIKELDNALNRIGGYDEVNGGTIINYGLSEIINKDTVIYNTYSEENYVPLYSKPLPNSENIILRLQKDDIIHVLRRHPEETAAGWYQVVVLSATMDIQDANGKEELKEAYKKNVSIEGHIEATYIWEYWQEINGEQYKAPMPDVFSKLYQIPTKPSGKDNIEFSNEQLISIIQETYYDEVIIFPLNSDGESFEPAEPKDIITFPSRSTSVNDAEINNSPFFRFCLNLLIYANNPRPQDNGVERSIYPDFDSGKQFFTKDVVEDAYEDLAVLYENETNPTELYNHFITYIANTDPSGGYRYIDTSEPTNQKIKVLLKGSGNYYMWVPSRQCAESLWRMVNYVYIDELPLDDPVTQLAEYAIEAMFPQRSMGSRLKVELGATYAFIGADFVGDISIWREDTELKNSHILKISAYGELRAGVDIGVEGGFGFWLGGNNKKRERPGIGAAVGASVQGQGKITALIEFEIPITGRDPLSRGLSAMLYSSVGVLLPAVAPFAFFRASENFNLDLWNYMTKLKLYSGIYGNSGAYGSIGFKYGNTQDMPTWQNAGADSQFLNATKLPSLLSGAALSGGISIGGEFGFGFDIDVKYYTGSDYAKCMRTDGTRVPLEVKLFAFGEGQLHGEFFTSLSLGLIGIPILPGFLLQQGLGIKIGIVYNISGDTTVIDGNTSNFDFSFGKMIEDGKKIISLYNFSGDLDRYEDYGYETTYNFNFDELVNIAGDVSLIKPGGFALDPASYQFGFNLEEILNQLDGVEFKKRLGLGFMRRKYRSMKRAQAIVGERWHKAKADNIGGKSIGSLKINSYLDLDYTVKGEDYIKAVKALAVMTQVGVALGKSTNIADLDILNVVLDDFTDENKSLDDKINYAVDIYSNAIISSILSANAPASEVFFTLLNMSIIEVGNKTGFYHLEGTSFSTMDTRLKEMVITMAINYVSKWEDIRISLHNEIGYGFALGGSLGLGAKVRGFLGIEYGIVMHSDFIKNDYVYNNYWSGVIKTLLNISPGTLSGGQKLTGADKEKVIQVFFDKQL